MCTYTHIHTHTHPPVYTCSHTSHTSILACPHIYLYTPTFMLIVTHIFTYIYILTLVHSYMHTHSTIHVHTFMSSYTCSYKWNTPTYSHTHARTPFFHCTGFSLKDMGGCHSTLPAHCLLHRAFQYMASCHSCSPLTSFRRIKPCPLLYMDEETGLDLQVAGSG